jgi:pectin methylesterase-like acyl-CoA thioesterase
MKFNSPFFIVSSLISLASGRALLQDLAQDVVTSTSTSLIDSAPSSIGNGVNLEARAAGTSRTSSPAGCLVVGGSGTYSTFADAIKALGSKTTAQCIFLSAGTYKEQVTVNYAGKLTIYGSTTE